MSVYVDDACIFIIHLILCIYLVRSVAEPNPDAARFRLEFHFYVTCNFLQYVIFPCVLLISLEQSI